MDKICPKFAGVSYAIQGVTMYYRKKIVYVPVRRARRRSYRRRRRY